MSTQETYQRLQDIHDGANSIYNRASSIYRHLFGDYIEPKSDRDSIAPSTQVPGANIPYFHRVISKQSEIDRRLADTFTLLSNMCKQLEMPDGGETTASSRSSSAGAPRMQPPGMRESERRAGLADRALEEKLAGQLQTDLNK